MTTRPPRSPDVCHVINRHVSRNTFATVKRCNGTLPIDRSCRRTSVTFHPFFALLFVGERSPITVAKSFVGDTIENYEDLWMVLVGGVDCLLGWNGSSQVCPLYSKLRSAVIPKEQVRTRSFIWVVQQFCSHLLRGNE
ncbi:zinc finger protein [Musa troglodytarum]|uniref:Zinc finger protein n=1 Tax=Musa troglodytarum TaxID=320322 RepID=A0A9E7HKF5_9LILI|nr:zinc finger protein [Musa troglodytarum]